MSNLIRTNVAGRLLQLVIVTAVCAGALSGCGNVPTSEAQAQAGATLDQPLAQASAVNQAGSPTTDAPAEPQTEGGAILPTSRVISKEEMSQKFPDRGDESGCFITFAYAGHAPETLIWDRESCTALNAQFMTPAELKKYNDWDRLDADDQRNVMALPERRVLYVGGQFTASVYPLGHNNLTYQVVVTD